MVHLIPYIESRDNDLKFHTQLQFVICDIITYCNSQTEYKSNLRAIRPFMCSESDLFTCIAALLYRVTYIPRCTWSVDYLR